jgi:KamA family protein
MLSYKSYSIGNFESIPQIEKFNENQKFEMRVVGNVLPFKTNNYVVNELIDWDNVHDDPMFKLTFPQKEMLLKRHYHEMAQTLKQSAERNEVKAVANKMRKELNPHPAGQKQYNVPEMEGIKLTGMQHKYDQTVLFFPSQGQTCHAYCTFCFRWPQFVGMDEMKFAAHEGELLAKYVKQHPEITDILFTGGDPLIMKTKILSGYIQKLLDEKIPNLQTIRIGTKALGYWPYRFTLDEDANDLMKLFEKIVNSGINLSIMAHFNHPVELSTKAVEMAINRINGTGAQIRTQSPLLKHINDTPELWAEMWRTQVNMNCIPYYMFIPRDTGAQHYFAIPLVKTWDIFRNAYQKVSGICRTVRGPSMSCTAGKIQVLGVSDIYGPERDDKIITLRFLQGRNPDWVGKPFFAEYNENALWIDDLKPAFNQDKFFYEMELEEIFNSGINEDASEILVNY